MFDTHCLWPTYKKLFSYISLVKNVEMFYNLLEFLSYPKVWLFRRLNYFYYLLLFREIVCEHVKGTEFFFYFSIFVSPSLLTF